MILFSKQKPGELRRIVLICRLLIFFMFSSFFVITGCTNEITNNSVLTIHGYIDSVDQDEVEKSQLYVVGFVSYIPVDESGEQLEIRYKLLIKGMKTLIKVDADGYFSLDYLVQDRRSDVTSLRLVEPKLKILKITGDMRSYHQLEFSKEGITENADQSFSLKVDYVDIN